MRRFVAVSLILNILVCLLVGCAKDVSVEDCIGGIDYSSSMSALMYEQIAGEEEGFYGIQYHEVIDINGITAQTDIPVVLYFYSSSATGSQSLTAGVEDLAQTLSGQVLFVSIDGVEADEVSTAYQLAGYPEFILIRDGARVATFEGYNYEYWDINDVTWWLEDYGFTPDMSLLEG
ncbi:MAG: thioredoxin [Saccharofermentans sp.]|nr:thioredoxin [Saccharofermentans sp.]